jgi:hypothetical protein
LFGGFNDLDYSAALNSLLRIFCELLRIHWLGLAVVSVAGERESLARPDHGTRRQLREWGVHPTRREGLARSGFTAISKHIAILTPRLGP